MPLVRQMITETGYIDYVKESSKIPNKKGRLDNIEALYLSIAATD